uniref:Chromate resistance protein ChrB n=1 Tax=Sphingomonas sp. AR_OL41 TaxID=3042729 RepID=UPI002480CF12|nr:Chromate resistance protein ChrB [Sphingomonas sp. AR_OL41]
MSWLLLLAQLPAEPSSARVALWRRLRGSGAISIVNGVWALPRAEAHAELFASAAARVREQGGRASTFSAQPLDVAEADALVVQSRADRGREYDEFAERADAMLAEIDKETRKQKFTFAELEEIEQDHEKLTDWLAKIERRDFFPDARLEHARVQLKQCGDELRIFGEKVFVAEGVNDAAKGAAGPGHDRPGR